MIAAMIATLRTAVAARAWELRLVRTPWSNSGHLDVWRRLVALMVLHRRPRKTTPRASANAPEVVLTNACLVKSASRSKPRNTASTASKTETVQHLRLGRVSTRSSPRMLVLLLLPLHSHGAITMQHTAAPLLRAPPLQLRQLRVQPRQLRMVTNYGSLEDDDGACSVRGLRDGEICWEPLDPLPSAEKPDYFELPLNESWSPLRAASLRFARVRKLAYQAMGSPLLLLPAACFSWWLLPVLSNLDFFQRSLQATQAGRDSIGSIEGPPRPPSEAAPA